MAFLVSRGTIAFPRNFIFPTITYENQKLHSIVSFSDIIITNFNQISTRFQFIRCTHDNNRQNSIQFLMVIIVFYFSFNVVVVALVDGFSYASERDKIKSNLQGNTEMFGLNHFAFVQVKQSQLLTILGSFINSKIIFVILHDNNKKFTINL